MTNKTNIPNAFTLKEVSVILGIPKNRIKNWTMGRPFRILEFSQFQTQGKGAPHLYSLFDLRRFFIVEKLRRDGFNCSAIGAILQDLESETDPFESFREIVFSEAATSLLLYAHPRRGLGKTLPTVTETKLDLELVKECVNLALRDYLKGKGSR